MASTEHHVRTLNADGQIPTDSGLMLADEIGNAAWIRGHVDYISPITGDLVYGLIVAPGDTGTALLVLDAQDHTEATAWIGRDSVTLAGHAATVLGQPALDLRRHL